jgi:hypothetical protein
MDALQELLVSRLNADQNADGIGKEIAAYAFGNLSGQKQKAVMEAALPDQEERI